MLLKLLPIALALFTFTGSISSSSITKEMYDHRDEPSNTYAVYNSNVRQQVIFTLKYQQGDYREYGSTWSYCDYDLICNYTYSSNYDYSRLYFSSLKARYFRTGPSDYDELEIPIYHTFSIDGYNLNDFNNAFEFNISTDYVTESFQCEFFFSYYLYGQESPYTNFEKTFMVDEEYDYDYYQESSNFTLNFAPFGNYSSGFDDGKNYVLTHLSEFDLYTQSQYLTYGQIQYNLGASEANTGFMSLFGAIADTPVIMIRNLFSFDLFGMSALTIFMSLLTGLIVIHFIRKVI